MKNFGKYIRIILRNSFKWQKAKIGNPDSFDRVNAHWYSFSTIQIGFILVGVLYAIFIGIPFSKDLMGYVVSMFSIFIGLLLSLVFVVYDKYQNNQSFEENLENPIEGSNHRRDNRYFRQFTTLMIYAIFIAMLDILLLIPCFIEGNMNELGSNLIQYLINLLGVSDLILKKVYRCLIGVYQITIIYFILDFFLLLGYGITSFYVFIDREYNN